MKERIKGLHITYFPLEQKYSIWNDNYDLIKEWFNSREEAVAWIEEEYNGQRETEYRKREKIKL